MTTSVDDSDADDDVAAVVRRRVLTAASSRSSFFAAALEVVLQRLVLLAEVALDLAHARAEAADQALDRLDRQQQVLRKAGQHRRDDLDAGQAPR